MRNLHSDMMKYHCLRHISSTGIGLMRITYYRIRSYAFGEHLEAAELKNAVKRLAKIALNPLRHACRRFPGPEVLDPEDL